MADRYYDKGSITINHEVVEDAEAHGHTITGRLLSHEGAEGTEHLISLPESTWRELKTHAKD